VWPFLIVAVLVAVAVSVAALLSRRGDDAPEQGPSWLVPTHLDRLDFERPEAPWLVTVFTSSTCLACEGTWEKAQILDSETVAVQKLDAVDDKASHDRYKIDAVPMVLVVDALGRVCRSFVGEPTATDLWAALAELRDPGTVPPSCTHD